MRQRYLCLIAAATLVSVSAMGGCVRQDKYNNLLTDNRTLTDRVNRSENQLDATQLEVQQLRSELRETRQQLDDLMARNTSLSGELGQLGADLQAIARQLQPDGIDN